MHSLQGLYLRWLQAQLDPERTTWQQAKLQALQEVAEMDIPFQAVFNCAGAQLACACACCGWATQADKPVCQ